MYMLDACGFHPVIGVEELRQKALITISHGVFDMHDLVQEMGHHIVRGEHPKNPEKHSRIWKKEDILTICAMDATMDLDKIEAIDVDYDRRRSTIGLKGPLPPIVANMSNLRYIRWKGDPANPLLNNFPPKGLCCLILRKAIQDQLWSGNKYLPNLKIMELHELDNLIKTPIFDGLRSLKRFQLSRCRLLEEIHSSFGGLDELVCLVVEHCTGIKEFPSISRLKKLETLSFRGCCSLFELSGIQQKMENLRFEDMSSDVSELSKLNHIRLCFFRKDLRMLDLGSCRLGDEDIGSSVWELPNLQELHLPGNDFSRLSFSLIRTPRLKLLDVSSCYNLVELSRLPSSIAILKANYCPSLETFGDVSNCKWLWKVLLSGTHRLVPLDGNILLDSILKGYAIEDHVISVTLEHEIPKEIVGGLLKGNTFTLPLPSEWYNEYCGFLIHVVTSDLVPEIDIIIKQEADEEPGPEYHGKMTYDKTITHVGYVSFNSLRRTTCLNSTYNVISISFSRFKYYSGAIGAVLVPRKSKDADQMQKTRDYSEFWDEKYDCRPTFAIQHDKLSIKIFWEPLDDQL